MPGVAPSPPPAGRAPPRSSRSGACTSPRPGRERVGEVTCETDRARFLGRGRSTRDPVALERDGPLSMTTGAVLDPIFALRARVTLPPGPVGVGGVHHARGDQPGPGLRAGRPLPRPACGAARPRPRLDLEPGGAPGTRPHARRWRRCSRSWPGSSSTATRRCGRRRRSCGAERVAAAPLGQRRVGRLADPARHHRLGRWPADPAAAARGPPLLAPAGDDGGPRHPQHAIRPTTCRTSPTGSPARSTRWATRARWTAPGGVFLRRQRPAHARAAPHAPGDGAGPHPLRRPAARPDPGECTRRTRNRRPTRTSHRLPPSPGRPTGPMPAWCGWCGGSGRGSSPRSPRSRPSWWRSRPRRPPAPRWRSPDNGFGGLTARRRLRDPGRGRPGAAGAVGQRDRQSARRLRGDRAGRRVHLGGEQLLLPAHALAQRSGERPGERGGVPAGRRDGRALVARRRDRCGPTQAFTVRHGAGNIHASPRSTAGSRPSSRWAWPRTPR